jgi:hypothetical protein
MVVPGTTQDMFEDIGKMRRLVKLVSDYLDSSETRRIQVEGMAADLAELNRQGPDGTAVSVQDVSERDPRFRLHAACELAVAEDLLRHSTANARR